MEKVQTWRLMCRLPGLSSDTDAANRQKQRELKSRSMCDEERDDKKDEGPRGQAGGPGGGGGGGGGKIG